MDNILISSAGAVYMAIVLAKAYFNVYTNYSMSYTRDKFFYIPIGLLFFAKFLCPDHKEFLYYAIAILVFMYALNTIFEVVSANLKD